MYAEGVGVDKDPVKANGWYQKAADQGHLVALLNLDRRYKSGVGVQKDPVKAAEMFKGAGERGCVGARYFLARMMLEGEGMEKDESGGMALIRSLAGDEGNGSAVCYLALATCKGLYGIEKDEAKAARRYEKAIETGSMLACLRLGRMHACGMGVEQDHAKALELYRRAADGGQADGWYELSQAYWLGKGVDQPDREKAIRCLAIGAERGSDLAQFQLGVLYHDGDGLQQDKAEAARLWQLAADQGHPYALLRLGVLYLYCKGVAQDAEKGLQLLEAARGTDQGNLPAMAALGSVYKDGIEGAVAADPKKALALLQAASDAGNLDAMTLLWFRGIGVERHLPTAVDLYTTACDGGYAFAQNLLGVLYERGILSTTPERNALKYFGMAAKQGYPNAMFNLGRLYFDEMNDVERGVEWMLKAAEAGCIDAQNRIGVLYDRGEAVPQDNDKAFRWHQQAADKDHPDALVNIAYMYLNGRGVAPDAPPRSRAHEEGGGPWPRDRPEPPRPVLRGRSGAAPPILWQLAGMYKLAAAQNLDEALFFLAGLYLDGLGVETKDEVVAVNLPRRAADQGHVRSLCFLGAMYVSRFSALPEDVARGVVLLRHASDLGDTEADEMLAEHLPESLRQQRPTQASVGVLNK